MNGKWLLGLISLIYMSFVHSETSQILEITKSPINLEFRFSKNMNDATFKLILSNAEGINAEAQQACTWQDVGAISTPTYCQSYCDSTGAEDSLWVDILGTPICFCCYP